MSPFGLGEDLVDCEAEVDRLKTALSETLLQLGREHGHWEKYDAGWPSCKLVHPAMAAARALLDSLHVTSEEFAQGERDRADEARR